MDKNIPKCDPKHNFKPFTSRENIEWTKFNPEVTINYARQRYKEVRQVKKCDDFPHDWSSSCHRCAESHKLEQLLAFIELYEESKGK